MGVWTGFAVWLVIWWLVLFMVLPFGVRRPEEHELTPGQEHGAPVKPHLVKKMVITTVISLVVFGVYYVIQDQGWISLRDQAG